MPPGSPGSFLEKLSAKRQAEEVVMQKKTSGISPFLLVLMQIGLILTLLVWWGLLGKFLLPAGR